MSSRREYGGRTSPVGYAEQAGRSAAGTAVIILFIIFLAEPSRAQPQVTLNPSPQTVPINRQLCVTLELAWSGEADIYDTPPPDLSDLTEFEILERNLSATRKGNRNVLRHEFIMRPKKTGEYDLGQMTVTYYEKGVDVPTPIPIPRTSVRVTPRELVPRAVTKGIAIGALAAMGGLAALFAARKKKNLQKEHIDSARTAKGRRESLLAELKSAAPLRIEGEMGAYLQKLCELAESAELRSHVHKIDELRNLTESVRFGGAALSPDRLSWAEKAVKNAIEKAFPIEDEEEKYQA